MMMMMMMTPPLMADQPKVRHHAAI